MPISQNCSQSDSCSACCARSFRYRALRPILRSVILPDRIEMRSPISGRAVVSRMPSTSGSSATGILLSSLTNSSARSRERTRALRSVSNIVCPSSTNPRDDGSCADAISGSVTATLPYSTVSARPESTRRRTPRGRPAMKLATLAEMTKERSPSAGMLAMAVRKVSVARAMCEPRCTQHIGEPSTGLRQA